MITDEMLKKAAGESEERFLADLPETHEFSEEFQRRMSRAKRRNLRNGSTAAQCVTLVLAACLTVFGGALGLNPEFRTYLLGELFGIQTSGQVTMEGQDFPLTVLPEGYMDYIVIETSNGKTYLFIDSVNSVVSYQCDWE